MAQTCRTTRCNDYNRVMPPTSAGRREPGLRQPLLEEQVFLALQMTAEHLQHASAQFFHRYDLSPTQYNALRILRGAGDAGLACSAIAGRMIHADPDITRLLGRLELRGLVGRGRDREDRRVVVAHITRAGLELLHSMDRPLQQYLRQMFAGMPTARLRSLLTLLEQAGSRSG